MAVSTVEIEGFKILEERLKALPENVARRGTLRAMRRAATIMQNEIIARAPRHTGNLADSIRIKARTRNLTGMQEYAQTLRAGGTYIDAQHALREARRLSGQQGARIVVEVGTYAPHAHLLEFGTVERFHKSGKSVGVMQMHPFMRPAFDGAAASCALAIERELKAEVLKMEARQAKLARAGGDV